MRTLIAALALALAACSPEQTTLSHPYGEPSEPASPLNADAAALAGAPAAGQWFERADEGTLAAGFGVPESEYQLVITCTQGSGAIGVSSSSELAPDQPTTLRVITPTRSIDLPARSFNEGLPAITAEIADAAPEKAMPISVLGAPADRFAIDSGGEIIVYPWDDVIARTLIACR